MRVFTMLIVAVTAVACATPPTFTRAELVPLLPVEVSAVAAGREAADAGRADRDQSASELPVAARRDGADTSAPIYRTLIETVEVGVPMAAQAQAQSSVVYVNSGRGYSTYDDYLYKRGVDRTRRRGTRFPVNTVVGAGVGAIIGHQRGRRDRGALIGAGLGLLFDLNRWSY
jgi:hypothetical protein